MTVCSGSPNVGSVSRCEGHWVSTEPGFCHIVITVTFDDNFPTGKEKFTLPPPPHQTHMLRSMCRGQKNIALRKEETLKIERCGFRILKGAVEP